MKKLTLSLLYVGLITTTVIAEENCIMFYETQNYEKSAECSVKKLKKERSYTNLETAGFSYMQLGRYKDALPYLKEAEKKVQISSDYRILCSFLSAAYGRTGDTIQELAYNMKFLDLSLKSGVRKNIGSAYNNLGSYYFNQEQNQKALEYFEKALKYHEELESSITYNNMAAAYNELEDYQKAEEMYQKAIMIDQKSGDYHSLGTHKMHLGSFYFTQHHNKEARRTLEDALVISRNGGNISSQSHALSLLAVIDYREGYIVQAKEKASEALRLAKQSGASATSGEANIAWKLVNGQK